LKGCVAHHRRGPNPQRARTPWKKLQRVPALVQIYSGMIYRGPDLVGASLVKRRRKTVRIGIYP